MNEKTLEALQESIINWYARVKGEISIPTRKNCPLCKLYNLGTYDICVGCPVYETTKQTGCGGTPVIIYTRYIRESLLDDKDKEKLRMFADQEVRFLINLLPEGVKPRIELPS